MIQLAGESLGNPEKVHRKCIENSLGPFGSPYAESSLTGPEAEVSSAIHAVKHSRLACVNGCSLSPFPSFSLPLFLHLCLPRLLSFSLSLSCSASLLCDALACSAVLYKATICFAVFCNALGCSELVWAALHCSGLL